MFASVLRAALAADVDGLDLGERQVLHLARVAAHAHQVTVVDHDDRAVARALHVEFDVVGAGHMGFAERGHRIFRRAQRGAAMGRHGDVLTHVQALQQENRGECGQRGEADHGEQQWPAYARTLCIGDGACRCVEQDGCFTPFGVHAGRQELVACKLQHCAEEAEGDGHGHEQRDQRQDALRIDAGPVHRETGEMAADAEAQGGHRRQAQPPQQQRRDRLQQSSLEHALAREQHVGRPQPVEHRDGHGEDPARELREQHEHEPGTGKAGCQQCTAPFRRLFGQVVVDVPPGERREPHETQDGHERQCQQQHAHEHATAEQHEQAQLVRDGADGPPQRDRALSDGMPRNPGVAGELGDMEADRGDDREQHENDAGR